MDCSETAELNLTKLDRKQDLNVLYQVCVFRADQKTKMWHQMWHIVLRCTICAPLGLLLWFKSYLTDRVQSVGWRGAMSKTQDVTIGVPQGSILGPLFCILFVNDYRDCLEYSHATIYADDTSQDVCDKSVDVIVEKLTTNLFNSWKWMKQNKLTMNLHL